MGGVCPGFASAMVRIAVPTPECCGGLGHLWTGSLRIWSMAQGQAISISGLRGAVGFFRSTLLRQSHGRNSGRVLGTANLYRPDHYSHPVLCVLPIGPGGSECPRRPAIPL